MDWSAHFPDYVFKAGDAEVADGTRRPGQLKKNIEVADIGCGFGGLLFALAPKMPDSLILGMEIRVSVTEFVQNKIRAMRHQAAHGGKAIAPEPIPEPIESAEIEGSAASHASIPQSDPTLNDTQTTEPSTTTTTSTPPDAPTNPSFAPAPPQTHPSTYKNIATHRTNTMKFLPNFLPAQSLTSIFLCFPDPHFKARKHKARIVSPALLSEYHYVLRPGGRVYTITDVEDLANWMAGCFERGRGFRRVRQEEWEGGNENEGEHGIGKGEGDWKVGVMWGETEEGMKVTRNKGRRWVSVWERLETPAWPGEEGAEDM